MAAPTTFEAGVLKEITALSVCTLSHLVLDAVNGSGANGMVFSARVVKEGCPLPPTYRVAVKVCAYELLFLCSWWLERRHPAE